MLINLQMVLGRKLLICKLLWMEYIYSALIKQR